jgi:alcohol dehydrogenase class IV
MRWISFKENPSMQNYELTLPHKIVFGIGKRHEVGSIARTLGLRAVLVSGSKTLEQLGFVRQLIDNLEQAGVSILTTETVSHEPETQDVDRLLNRLRGALLPGDFVIGFGGGSAIDLGKAIAALLPQEKHAPVIDYLEGVGRGFQLKQPPLPTLAIPTTAGTGAEVTKNAVIASYDPPFKKSLRHDRMMPQAVMIDPELTLHCPQKVTAESGLDAITQLLESYVSRKRQPFTDALVEQGLPKSIIALETLLTKPEDLEARWGMAHGAMLSGLALTNSGLGMAHGVAPALGTHCRVPHGVACALMLPTTLRTNVEVCADRYAKLSRLLFGFVSSVSDKLATERLIDRIEQLCCAFGLPMRLSDCGIDKTLIPAIARDSKGNSMSGNPKELSESDIEKILRKIF